MRVMIFALCNSLAKQYREKFPIALLKMTNRISALNAHVHSFRVDGEYRNCIMHQPEVHRNIALTYNITNGTQ